MAFLPPRTRIVQVEETSRAVVRTTLRWAFKVYNQLIVFVY